ncbi:MAG: shikimate kinase [Planctomycetales bacterium]|nr:shikimate kinase [Planctomycetales bacterium]
MMHIYLMGYRGSGKSSVGRRLAERLGLPIVDTDSLIESEAGQSIRQIFSIEGEAGFRQREASVVARAAANTTPSVIALGGGAILRPENQRMIASSGRVVWLHGSPASLLARIQADQTTAERRPRLSPHSDYDEIVEILAAREPIYRRLANWTVDTDRRTPDELVVEIVDWLEKHG